jgi:hypothetical protein
MGGQGIGQGDAFTDPLAYLGEHLLDRRLGGLVGKHGQGVEQRHAAAQQRGELAGEQGHVAGRHFTAQPGHPFAQRTALSDNFFVYVSGKDAQGAQFPARAAGTVGVDHSADRAAVGSQPPITEDRHDYPTVRSD